MFTCVLGVMFTGVPFSGPLCRLCVSACSHQANVMLEYDAGEAQALLQRNYDNANLNTVEIQGDLDFLRDQITTMEVSILLCTEVRLLLFLCTSRERVCVFVVVCVCVCVCVSLSVFSFSFFCVYFFVCAFILNMINFCFCFVCFFVRCVASVSVSCVLQTKNSLATTTWRGSTTGTSSSGG